MLWLTDASFYGHLQRLLLVGGISALVGIIFILAVKRWRDFGIMTAAWGAIDWTIAMTSESKARLDASTLIPTIAFNEGLDAGYVGVRLAMILLAGERKRIRAFGLAIVVQGAILLILDGKLWMDLANARFTR